jgi:phasin family protein
MNCTPFNTHKETSMFKPINDIQSMGKDGFEAYLASANAMTKGFQALAAEGVEYSRQAFEKGNEAFQKAAGAKSFDQAMEVQQGYAKQAMDAFSAQMTKVTNLFTTTAEEAYKPYESKFAQFGMKLPK